MTQVIFVVVALLWCVFLLVQLRKGQLREKYAVLWIVVAAVVVLLAAWPGALTRVARLAGVLVPANLLFFLAILMLLGVSLHLSIEASQLEEETRTLAEEVAILHADIDDLRSRLDAAGPGTGPDETS